MPIRAVFFDVGETLVDESRAWTLWADWLGVPRSTFFATLDAVIARGEHHRRVFEIFKPGFDRATEEAARLAAGKPHLIEPQDLYPDALPCLQALRARGYFVGIAGNQPAETEAVFHAMKLPVDIIASSAGWGVEKPSPEFFTRIAATAGCEPAQIAYVGDRLDNDILPAMETGLIGVFLVRGPWGRAHARLPHSQSAQLRIENLDELPAALADFT